MRRTQVAIGVALCLLAASPSARADAVDDAFARGNEAAAAGDWATAAREYEQARRLLPGRSALLSYDLGTAYAHLGQTGRATFHLRRALQSESDPSDEIVEAARRNLGILHRRAEIDATAKGAQLSAAEGWRDRMVVALTARAVAWGTLILGWSALALWLVRVWRLRRRGRDPVLGALALVLAGMFCVGASVHGVSVWAETSAPRAISLDDALEVRDGPGTHRKVAFILQGGSRVRIVERSPGWCRIRLEGGLEGWVPERAIGRIDGEDDVPALARTLPRDATAPG